MGFIKIAQSIQSFQMAEYCSLAQNCSLSLNIRIISTSSSSSGCNEGARPISLDIVTSADCSNFPQFHNSGMFYSTGYLSFDSRPQILMTRQIKTWQAGQLSKVQICNIPELPFQGAIIAFCKILTIAISFMREFWKLANNFHIISRVIVIYLSKFSLSFFSTLKGGKRI